MRIHPRTLMVPCAFTGAVGLFWMANKLAENASKGTLNKTIEVELRMVWATQQLIDFCKKHNPLPPDEEIIPVVRKVGFPGWYAFKTRH